VCARSLLVYLGEFWLEMARYNTCQMSAPMAIDLAMIEKMQGELLGVESTIQWELPSYSS
jgi:hypothetical protein